MNGELEAFLNGLNLETPDDKDWADSDTAFWFRAHRTWLTYWIWHGPDAGPIRVYTEKAGPAMRSHP